MTVGAGYSSAPPSSASFLCPPSSLLAIQVNTYIQARPLPLFLVNFMAFAGLILALQAILTIHCSWMTLFVDSSYTVTFLSPLLGHDPLLFPCLASCAPVAEAVGLSLPDLSCTVATLQSFLSPFPSPLISLKLFSLSLHVLSDWPGVFLSLFGGIFCPSSVWGLVFGFHVFFS